jgi:hypothetical protein
MREDFSQDSDGLNALLQDLRIGSEFLDRHLSSLKKLLGHMKIYSFYETHKTQTVNKVCIIPDE